MRGPCWIVIGGWHIVDVHWLNCPIIYIWKVCLYVCSRLLKHILLILHQQVFSPYWLTGDGESDSLQTVNQVKRTIAKVFLCCPGPLALSLPLSKSFFPLVILVVLGRLCMVVALLPHRNISALQDVKCNWSDWGQTR